MTKKSRNNGFLLFFMFITFCLLANSLNNSVENDYIAENSSDLDITPKPSAVNIDIITPENKTYTEPMSGYYPGTFGFENDLNGAIPSGWDATLCTGGCTALVVTEHDGHNNVVRLNDNTGGGKAVVRDNFASGKQNGTVEFWIHSENSVKDNSLYFNGIGGPVAYGIYLGQHVYWDGSWHNIEAASSNQWYHIRIDFECTTGLYEGLDQYDWHIYIDGVKKSGAGYNMGSSPTELNDILANTGQAETGVTYYLDAFGYSWDPNYEVGDNLNEGLLLSYENSTNLEWTGYSLDGQANKTISGNTTIPMPLGNGIHSIQVFGNDSSGTDYQSELISFTVDYWDEDAPMIVGYESIFKVEQDSTRYLYWNITEINNGTYILKRNDSTIGGPLQFTHENNVSVQINTNPLGDWNYTIIATDPSNNVGSHEVIVRIIDTVDPLVTMLNTSFSVMRGDNSSFSWNITETNELNYSLYLNGSLLETGSYTDGEEYTHSFHNWTLGELFFKVYANDTSGNSHTANITITIIERVDHYIFLTPNETNICDLISQSGLYVEFYSTEIAYLTVVRQSTNLESKQPGSQFQAYYFYEIKILDEDQDENDDIIGSMKVRFYYDASQVTNVNKLYILHFEWDIADAIYVWRALEATHNREGGYYEVIITDLSVFCLAEIKGDTNDPFLMFLIDNMLWIIILAAVGVAAPIYVSRSKKQKKAKTTKEAALSQYKDIEMADSLEAKALKKKEILTKRTWKPEEITKDEKLAVKAKKKPMKKPLKKPMKKAKKVEDLQGMPIDAIAEALQKRDEEIKQTESEISIKSKLDKCTIHKGSIEGISYVCPKCHAKYCINCAKTIKGKSEGCWVCDTPINIKGEVSEEDITTIPLKPQELKDIESLSTDEQYEHIFLNSSSILKIWMLSSQDNSEFFSETLVPDEQYSLILPQILRESYEKDKFIERAFKVGNKQLFALIYFSKYLVNTIILSKNRIDTTFYSSLKTVLDHIEEDYINLKDTPLDIINILNQGIFLYLSREYATIPPEMQKTLRDIFKDKTELEFIQSEVLKMPEGTFAEFLKLYTDVRKEMDEIKTNTDEDKDYFIE